MTDVEAGRYVCVRTPGFFGWLIRKVTKSQTNHAFLVTGPGELIEATPEGVRRGKLSEYAGRFAVANTAEPMSEGEREAAVAKAVAVLGDSYNFAADADIGLEDLGWHWRLLMRLSRAHGLLMCSQMIAECGQAAGLDWLCGKASADQVAPGDLARRAGVERVNLG